MNQTTKDPAPKAHQEGPEAPPPWFDGVQDTVLREFIQNKGWND